MNDEKYKQNLNAVTPGRRRDKSEGKQTEIRLLWEQVKHSGENPILPFLRNPSSPQLSPPFQNTQNTPHLPSARNGLRRVQATITERFWNQKPSTQSRALPAKEDACFKNHITTVGVILSCQTRRSLFLGRFWMKIQSDNCFETVSTPGLLLEG